MPTSFCNGPVSLAYMYVDYDIDYVSDTGQHQIARTVSESPVFTHCFSARLRLENVYDVVLIKSGCIEVHEFTLAGVLVERGRIALDCHIADAQVAAYRIKRAVKIEYNVFEEHPDDMELDRIVLVTADGQMIVVNWEDGALCSRVAWISSSGSVDRTDTRRYVAHLIAVQGEVAVITLWQDEIIIVGLETGKHRYFPVNGIIWHIVFMSMENDVQRVVVHVLEQHLEAGPESNRALLYLFEIDKNQQLTQQSRLPLSDIWQLPLLMVASSLSPFVFIISSTDLAAVQVAHIYSGSIDFPQIALGVETDEVPTSATISIDASKQTLYIAMSTGRLVSYDIQNNTLSAQRIIRGTVPEIGPLLRSLNVQDVDGDILLHGGGFSNGGIVQIRPDGTLHTVCVIPNYAPTFDCCVVNLAKELREVHALVGQASEGSAAKLSSLEDRHRLYLCHGRGETGCITELRQGHLATQTIDLELEHTAISKVWTLHTSRKLYLLMAMVWSEYKVLEFKISRDEVNVSEVTLDFNLSGRRILAANVWDDQIVIIDSKEVVKFDVHGITVTPRSLGNMNGEILSAAIDGDLVLFHVQNGINVTLELLKLEGFGMHSLQSTSLEHEASVVFLRTVVFRNDNLAVCLAGLGNAEHHLIIHDKAGFTYRHTWASQGMEHIVATTNTSASTPEFCAESYHVECKRDDSHFTLCIGLRNGTLLVYHVQLDKFEMSEKMRVCLGSSPLRLVPLINTASSILLALSSMPHIVSSLGSQEPKIDEVVLHGDRNGVFSSATAFQIEPVSNEDFAAIIVRDGTLEFVQIAARSATHARPMAIRATPTRLIYDKFLRHLIVACNDIESSDKAHPSCTLKFLDPLYPTQSIDGAILQDSDNGKDIFYVDERIHAMTPWHIQHQGRKYSYLCVGTRLWGKKSQERKVGGRLLILSVKLVRQGDTGRVKVDVRRRMQSRSEHPVYAIAPIGQTGLVYATGKSIAIKVLNLETLRFDSSDESFACDSPCTHLQVDGTQIIGTTLQDGLIELQYIDTLIPRSTDSKTRACYHALEIIPNGFLVSDKEHHVFHLGYQKDKPNDISRIHPRSHPWKCDQFYEISSMSLPSSATRLVMGHFQIPPEVISNMQRHVLAVQVDGRVSQLLLICRSDYHLLQALYELLPSTNRPPPTTFDWVFDMPLDTLTALGNSSSTLASSSIRSLLLSLRAQAASL